ncbi:MAG: iron-sulfur cluster assembly accessory protein [Rugosibacter sp.]|jgi:iron-sulfur cluster assembly protein
MNITITNAAEKFMRRMVRFGGAGEDAGFRLTVSPGGCSGYSSEFSVEAVPLPGDAAVVINGVKLFLPAESRLMLEGITIDFADTPTQSGLTFVNPNAAGCGTCGSSTGASHSHAKVDISALQRSV